MLHPADPVIAVRDLRMRYGTNDVLDGVEFDVQRGEVICLLGPNGAGKTTTIEILEGFRMRSAGEVSVLGEDPARAGEDWRARTGVVLQSWRDHPRWTPRRLLAQLGGYFAPYSTPEVERPVAVDALLEMVGLTDLADQKIVTLSGGQRRRLDVAIGIVGRPELLFLDEPTAGFDPHARRDFHHLVHRLSDLEGTTILLTTHDLDEAEKLADRILILADGTIVAAGSADQLARQVARDAEVRWSRDGETFVHSTDDATAFVRDLLNQHGDEVTDLEVRRASLEDIYIDLVHTHERPVREAIRMNPTRNAVRLGLRRGWTEFVQSVRSPQDQGFYLFTALLVLGYLWIRRNDQVEGTDLLVPSVALPSILGGLVAFGVVIGPAYALAMEREDGTLLRHKAVPHGLRGYFTGQLTLHSLGIVPQLLVILVPSFLLFDGVMAGGADGLADGRLGAGARDARDDAARDDHRGARAQHAEGRDLGHAAGPRPHRHLRDLLSRSSSCGAGSR